MAELGRLLEIILKTQIFHTMLTDTPLSLMFHPIGYKSIHHFYATLLFSIFMIIIIVLF